MSSKSDIEWTDATWNPVRGCTKLSPGCAHCYAEVFAERFRGVPGHPYEQGFDVRLVPEKLLEPIRWQEPRMIFVNSMSDLFHEDVPDDYITAVAAVMRHASWHTYQVLTKRSARLRDLLQTKIKSAAEEPHIWWGVSVENRRVGAPRIMDLTQTGARMRFLSIEPLLEDLGQIDLSGINWVIVGGESGAGARPLKQEWVVSIQQQCSVACVPFFFKQWGGVRKNEAGRKLFGRTYDEFPTIVRSSPPDRSRQMQLLKYMQSRLRERAVPSVTSNRHALYLTQQSETHLDMDTPQGAIHRFGGDWTREKLEILSGYLKAYTTALKRQNFRTGYIDAFAGSGYRTPSGALVAKGQTTLFEDAELVEQESQQWLEGSARIALNTSPRFDKYVFIERNQKRCTDLEALRNEFPLLANDINVHCGEANAAIRDICDKNWAQHRAVVFLDPYGMQVEWETVAAIARTKAIDMFLLFPLGIGVNRLLKRDADIPESWRRRLDLLLGTKDWYDEFYRFESRAGLFGDEPIERAVKASTETIGRYFNYRLKSIFAAVVEQPRVLRNKAGCPLYLLCFAAGNEKGATIAVRIAEHLMRL